MAFRKPTVFPRFADLKVGLAQAIDTDSALYKTIQVLLDRLDQLKDKTVDTFDNAKSGVVAGFATKFATYLTKADEIGSLPNSIQLLAGPGVTFDDSVPNKRTILTSTGGNHYDAPLTDGNVDETDLIFALGECIIVQVPV